MSKWLLTPERFPDETMEQYRLRRQDAKKYAKIIRNGERPTLFVQRRIKEYQK